MKNKKTSLSCNGTKITKYNDENETDMYVGKLTADEMSFAGAYDFTNYNYYLMNTNAKDNNLYWWSLFPYYFHEESNCDYAFYLNHGGDLDYDQCVDYDFYSRPAVTLKSDITVTTNPDITNGLPGTIGNPYIIN